MANVKEDVKDSKSTSTRNNNSGKRGNRGGNKNKNKRNNKNGNIRSDAKDTVKDNKAAETGSSLKFDNDPSYYFANAEEMNLAMQFSMNQFQGEPLTLGSTKKCTNWSILSISQFPSLDNTEVSPDNPVYNSGINWAARKLFQRISAFTGRNVTQYTPSDIAMMILAMGQILSMASYIRRGFAMAWTMQMRNRDLPSKLLSAAGIEYDDLCTHYANYKMQFNSLIRAANKIPIPFNVPYFTKCYKLYDKVYKDSDSEMSQLILTKPAYTWELDESSSSTGSVLKTVEVAKDVTGRPMSVYLTIFGNMIKALLDSTSLNVIYSDLLNLASKQDVPFLLLDLLLDDYELVPEYNEEFLLRMHNMHIMGEFANASGGTNMNDVIQDTNRLHLKYYPTFLHAAGDSVATVDRIISESGLALGTIIDFNHPLPSVEERVEATRYAVVMSANSLYEEGKGTYVHPATNGDLMVKCMTVYGRDSVGNNIFRTIYHSYAREGSTVWNDFLTFIYAMSKFDWSPRLFVFTGSGIATMLTDIVSDFNNYTQVSYTTMRNANNLIEQHLFSMS